jgi:Fic family protein
MRIIRRIKGKKTYFYLQHSFRTRGKVVTREKYLGRKIPREINAIKAELMRGTRDEIFSRLAKIRKNFQKEWRKYPEMVKTREKEEIAIGFTYNTNAIEGSTITLSETREIIHDNVSPNKPLKDIRETESHSRVFLDMLDEKEDITNRMLQRWHRKIFEDTKTDIAGQYRNYLVRVGSHIAPDWKKVNNLMNRLVVFIRNADANAVELAARAHYRFEKIHPFGDGNGRIGRLIMNHILWRRGYPMLIVEYKKRKSYYNALARDEEGFVGYFLKIYIRVHKSWI